MSIATLVNGEPCPWVAATDRGFQFGDGVFTTVAVSRGIPLFLSRHLARLRRDCERVRIPFPGEDVLSAEALALCGSTPAGVLKIQVTRGSGGRGYRFPADITPTRVLGLHPSPSVVPGSLQPGVTVRICHARLGINPILAGVKHMNRLEQIMARAEWERPDIHEGIMLDCEGYVVEGIMSNLFLVSGGRVSTPLVDRCGVAGVMREIVIGLAEEHDVALDQRRITREELMAADQIFLTNSVIGIWPVRQVEGHDYSTAGLTRDLMRWLSQCAAAETRAACIA